MLRVGVEKKSDASHAQRKFINGAFTEFIKAEDLKATLEAIEVEENDVVKVKEFDPELVELLADMSESNHGKRKEPKFITKSDV